MSGSIDWIELCTAALAAWLQAFEQAALRGGPMQSEHRRALAAAHAAADALAAGTPVRARFYASISVARSGDDEEFYERSRCWELRIDGSHVEARRWCNAADMVGASQSQELEAAGDVLDPVPDQLGDWAPTLALALERADCFVQGRCEAD